jgi:hypothetical protein
VSAQQPPDGGAARTPPALSGDETPARHWFARLLCALGFHPSQEPIGMHRWVCTFCHREWGE